ncbi:MAG: hypothetical protein JWQ11_4125 [Rhizobacter sp.]|nr:hypothetical protein [Rhizobacter sp.]
MSLYYTQKVLYELNRSPAVQERYLHDREGLLAGYELTEEERQAFRDDDIGLLYVLGVNGQILMHYAAFLKVEWNDYLTQMRDGVTQHGRVRAGVYAMTTDRNVTDDKARPTVALDAAQPTVAPLPKGPPR